MHLPRWFALFLILQFAIEGVEAAWSIYSDVRDQITTQEPRDE